MLGNKEIMAKNIRYYMDKYKKTRNDVCKDLGFAYSTFTDWINGNKYPRIDKIEMMANYFHVTKADLVEDHNSISFAAASGTILGKAARDPKQIELLNNYQQLDDGNKDKLLEFSEALILLPKSGATRPQ